MTAEKLLNHIQHLAEKMGPALVTRDGELHAVELAEKVAQSDEAIDRYEDLVLSVVQNMEDDIIKRTLESRREKIAERRHKQNHQPKWKPKNR